MAAVEATDCAIDGTVNDANLEVLAFDCTGAAGDKSLISGGAIFDAMTMGCFKFDSSLDGLGTAFDFSIVLADLTGLANAAEASAFLATFLAGISTALAGMALTTDFAIGLLIF
ncbi:MAG: hypothetical protein ABL923_05805 [Burkholderiaceae bacterium]